MLVFCHTGCTQEQVISALRSRGLWAQTSWQTFARLKAPVQPIGLESVYYAKRTKAALAIWQTSESITGSLAEKYLASRGLTLPGTPALRFHSRLRHSSGLFLPAMVALVRRLDGEPVGIHRTFLKHDGTGKADVVPQRLMLGPCRGGCVRLGLADAEIMVGEGIETTISAMISTGKVGWAALSTSGLRALELPPTIRDVIILADGDDPGEAAAQFAAWRWCREGRRIRLARAPDGGDFNDTLMDAARKEKNMNQAHKRIQDAINNAPEFQDPLDAIVERIAIDPTTPFAPEILERLRAMKAEDFKSFELLRTELKKAGCRMGALDKAIDGNNDPTVGVSQNQADILIHLGNSADLFHTPDGDLLRRY